MGQIWQRFCGFLLCIIVGLGLLAFIYPPSRQWPAHIIVRHDRKVKSADAIIMLMGDVLDRSPQCARLVKNGFAPVIVFVETEQDELNKLGYRLSDGEASFRYLKKLGVKDESILFDKSKTVTSTAEEIQADFKLIKERLPKANKVIICTSWYHSSRAQWVAEKFNTFAFGYELKAMPSQQPKSWYAKESNFLAVFNEYLKWIYYLLKY